MVALREWAPVLQVRIKEGIGGAQKTVVAARSTLEAMAWYVRLRGLAPQEEPTTASLLAGLADGHVGGRAAIQEGWRTETVGYTTRHPITDEIEAVVVAEVIEEGARDG